MKTIFTLGFALCTAVTSFAQGIAFYDGTWDEILAKAKKEHKMIFLDAYTSWCGPCKMLVNQTFPQPEVGIFFNSNFVNTHFELGLVF